VAADIIQPRPEQTDSNTGLAERSLYHFSRQAWPVLVPDRPYVDGWHIGCIAEHLQALEELQIRNLVINVPPRHMKSLLACCFFFAWAWIRNPSSQWIFCAYGENLAHRDSNKCRDLIQSQWYQARWGHVFRIKRAQNSAERFANDRQGYRIATTVAGKAMGEGGDFLVYDDPHKPTEVYSDAMRLAVISEWQKTMSTRGNDPKRVRKMVIMQRLHERDLAGYLLAERGGYEHLCLPAEYEPRRYFFPQAQGNGAGQIARICPDTSGTGNGSNGHTYDGAGKIAAGQTPPRDAIVPTLLQRTSPHLLDGPSGSGRQEDGDLLWPERFGPAEIESLKADLEGVGWAGQGQQRPAPATGSIFRAEMFRRFTLEPGPRGLSAILGTASEPDDPEPLRLPVQECRFYQCVDTAMTVKAQSAFTVVMTFAWHRLTRNLLIWNIFRQRLRVHEQLPAIRELRAGQALWDPSGRKWLIPGRLAPWPRLLAFQAVEDRASGHGILDEARASGYPLRSLKTGGQDKVMRAAVAATMYGAGRIWHRGEVSWLPDLEDELLSFPQGAFADQVDVIGYGCRLADEDALLNAGIEGPLLMPVPLNEEGLPATPEDLRQPQGRDVFHVGGTQVVFEDADPNDGWND